MGAPPDASGRTSAYLKITLSTIVGSEAGVSVEAQLLRYRDLDSESARVLAGATGPYLDDVAPGQCARVDTEDLLEDALASSSPDSAVELLDAGELLVRGAGRVLRLVPRALPEFLPYVSGVLYQSEALVSGTDLPAEEPGEVFLSAFGGEDVGRSDATIAAPPAPRLLTVRGRRAREGVVLDRSRNIDVRFDAPQGTGDDVVSVTLSWSEGGGGFLRCRPAQPGRATIGHRLLVDLEEGSQVELAVERLVRAPLSAPGLESGGVDVVVRDAVPARIL